jgi:large subunit ribosomal protein L46
VTLIKKMFRACLLKRVFQLEPTPLSNTIRSFASGGEKQKKFTWKKQQRVMEAKRKDQIEKKTKVPREKIIRSNYLMDSQVEDGKKWRILSASITERLPVIQPDLEKWEEDFEMMQHERSLREDQRLPEDFWFMEPGTRHITPEEAPLPNAEQDPDEIIGANFHFAPRETPDDALNNRKSLHRALKGRVFLIIKQKKQENTSKYSWFFPYGSKQKDEKMRDAAVRHLKNFCGQKMQVYPVGYAPIGYISYLHDEKIDQKEFDGTKIFFYKAQHMEGDVDLTNKSQDYLWVTRQELAEYLDPEIADYVTKIVPP